MNGKIIFVPDQQGAEAVDITEGVQVLYDTVISSMDWGSGFLTVEDALPIVAVAKACGFEQAEEAERYVNNQQHSDEQTRFLRSRVAAEMPSWLMSGRPHDHVWSSVGRCMWPRCKEVR